jgi:hypothetical protein
VQKSVGNDSLHEISNDNDVRIVNEATSKKYISRVQLQP